MKLRKTLALLLCGLLIMGALAACGGGKKSAVDGTWKQTDEVNGNWVWTFDGGKAKLVGETTGFTSEGTYEIDENNKKLKVTLKDWSSTKEYTYTLSGDTLDLKETYSSYHLKKQ